MARRYRDANDIIIIIIIVFAVVVVFVLFSGRYNDIELTLKNKTIPSLMTVGTHLCKIFSIISA